MIGKWNMEQSRLQRTEEVVRSSLLSIIKKYLDENPATNNVNNHMIKNKGLWFLLTK
jgi:hypothetical protein